MGQYEPNDSRDVTHSSNSAPGEPPRTGAGEDEARRQAQARQQAQLQSDAQPGYGNARDEDGTMEQDVDTENDVTKATDDDEAVVPETSANPAERARGDAQRPLYEPSDKKSES